MRCSNCGIAMQRLQRHLMSSLSAHHTRLSHWITNAQTQWPLDTFICHPYFLLLSTEAGEHERLLGHNMVCLGCGKSVRKIRHHNVSMECLLLAVLLSQKTNYVPSRNNYVCHVCWMFASNTHDKRSCLYIFIIDRQSMTHHEACGIGFGHQSTSHFDEHVRDNGVYVEVCPELETPKK